MARSTARLNRRHQDLVREKIRASQLIVRLQKHVDGDIELTASQVQAAKILLDKILSNAPTDIQHSGSVSVEIVRFTPAE